MSQDKNKNVIESAGALKLLIISIIGGFIAIILYAIQPQTFSLFVSILSVGTMVAGASLLSGGLIGFLFGIPRTLQHTGPGNHNTEQNFENKTELQGAAYKANTNLEQISDWLTKILVGVGLTQLTSLPGSINTAAKAISAGLGGFYGSEVFGAAIIIYFSICGFLLGCLWTRLYLAGAFKQADLSMTQFLPEYIATLDTVEAQLTEGNKQQVQKLRLNAERKLASLSEFAPDSTLEKLNWFAREYEQIRRSMSSGDERTFKMSTLMAQVRAFSIQANLSPDTITNFFKSGSPGNRVVALNVLDITRYPECIDIVFDAISHSTSAFEQYAALKTAENLLANINKAQMGQLADIINDQRSGGPGKYIIPESDRWPISERILAALGK